MAEKTISTRQKQKYDTSTNWTTNNIVLLAGEIGIESDTNKFKVGNGTSTWNELDYAGGSEIPLYSTTGQNTDGAMTQKAVTDAIPTTLSDLNEDSSHRTVTDAEKTTWNAKSNFSGNYNDLTNKPTIPTTTSQLTNDSNFVSDSAYVHTDNNYTTAEKNKLAGIETGAEVNTVTSVAGKTGAVVLTATDVGALPDSTFVSTININGQPQTTVNFDSDPQTQIDNIANNTTLIQNSNGGFSAGTDSSATWGGAVGYSAVSEDGGSIGQYSQTTSGGAVGALTDSDTGFAGGHSSKSLDSGVAIGDTALAGYSSIDQQYTGNKPITGVAIGSGAKTFIGVAIGYNAIAHAPEMNTGPGTPNVFDCIQLGTGTNNNSKTLQVYDDNIYDANTHNLSLLGSFSALNNIGGGFSISDPVNVGIELGRKDGTPGTPYFDFHTDGNPNTDFNVRLLASGSELQITAADGISINGVPIIESGSNTNGYYTKLADGTLICRYSFTDKLLSGHTVTFPHPFISTEDLSITTQQARDNGISPTYINSQAINNVSKTGFNVYAGYSESCTIYWKAIGRWK